MQDAAASNRVIVLYTCARTHRSYKVELNPTHIKAMFFRFEDRDGAWGEREHSRETWVDLVRKGVAWSVPIPVAALPGGSSECICFEDEWGNLHCVCEME